MTELASLLRKFESLGNTCEFGGVQRAGGWDPPGLFRNAGFLHTDQMIRAMDEGLDGLFDDGMYSFARPEGWADYSLTCLKYGFVFHTAVPATESEERAKRCVPLFRMIKRLFLEGLSSGDKIFVYRHNISSQMEPEAAERLLAALRKHGPNWLLFVQEDQRPEARFAYAHATAPGLVMAGIPRLFNGGSMDDIEFAAWEKILRIAVDIRTASSEGDARAIHTHFRSAADGGVLFAIDCDGLAPGTEITAEADINIPDDYDGSGFRLQAAGHAILRAAAPDPAEKELWQTMSMTTRLRAGETRAVAELTSEGGTNPVRVSTRDWKLRIAPPRRTYQTIRCYELPRQHIQHVSRLEDIDVPLVPISFGQTVRPEFAMTEYPEGGWDGGHIAYTDIYSVEVRNAVIHGDQGMVTIDDMVLSESLRLTSLQAPPFRWESSDSISIAATDPQVRIASGAHLFSGYPGNHIYARFLGDVLAAAALPFTPADRTLIWPDLRYQWQRDLFALTDTAGRSIFLGESGSVQCERLHLSPLSLMDAEQFPHPGRMAFVRQIKHKIGFDPAARRKLYISQKDSHARPLLNEDAVIDVLVKDGFEVLTLSGMPVQEQIRAFAEASCVVAPHGAGSTNVVFCPPGTAFCEILVDSYVQWSMRRLASLVPLRYGCVIASESGPVSTVGDGRHVVAWKVNIDQIRAALAGMSR